MAAAEWTLEELIGRVTALLDGTAYAGAPNGRVRDVPDARAVRWYTTIGLVDRPQVRGRTALYGPRHLLQLVAIKRRQSQGYKIADIQAELAEAPDDVLLGIADLPPGVSFRVPPTASERLAALVGPASGTPPRRFWVHPPSEYLRKETAPGQEHETAPGQEHETAPGQEQGAAPRQEQQTAPGQERGAVPGRLDEGLLAGVPLGGGTVLLLPGTPTADDLPLIRAAARDLMDLLAARGLAGVVADQPTDPLQEPERKTRTEEPERQAGAEESERKTKAETSEPRGRPGTRTKTDAQHDPHDFSKPAGPTQKKGSAA